MTAVEDRAVAHERILRTLRQVRRRLISVRALESGLRWMLYGAALAALAIALAALVFSVLPAWARAAYPYGPLVLIPLAFIVGAGVRLVRPVTLLDSAIYLDRRAGLEERVSTAFELIRAGDDAPLAALVQQQAVGVCNAFRPGMISYTRRLHRDTRYLVVALVACAALLWLPPLRTEGYIRAEQHQARRDAAARQLKEFLHPIRKKELDRDERLSELMKELEKTVDEFRRGSATAPERDLAALNRLRTELQKELARAEAKKDLADSVKQAKQVKGLEAAFDDSAAGADKRKSLADRMAEGKLSTAESKALRGIGQDAQKAGDRSGDEQLAAAGANVRDAAGAGQGGAEALGDDLNRIAGAADKAAGETAGQGAVERQAQIAAAIDAVDRAKRECAGESAGERTASAGSQQPCGTCGGTGKDANGNPCPDCGGTGKQGAGQGKQGQGGNCTTCGGTGKDAAGNPCPDCGGTGKQGGACSACGGTGKDAQGNPCKACGGTGAAAGGTAVAGGGSTNMDNPSGPGDQSEQEEVNPESEFARIYRERSTPHTSTRIHAPGEIGEGKSAGKQTIRGTAGPDERARIAFSKSFAEAARAAEEAIEETPIPADMRNLVRKYFTPDAD